MTALEKRVLLSTSTATDNYFDYHWFDGQHDNVGLGAGTTVQEGSTITHFVSKPTITVNLTNLPQHDALAITVGIVIMHQADHTPVNISITGADKPLLTGTFSNPWEDPSHPGQYFATRQTYPGGFDQPAHSGLPSTANLIDIDGNRLSGSAPDEIPASFYTVATTLPITDKNVTLTITGLTDNGMGGGFYGMNRLEIHSAPVGFCMNTTNTVTGHPGTDPPLISNGFDGPLNGGFGWNGGSTGISGLAGNSSVPDQIPTLMSLAATPAETDFIVVDNSANSREFNATSPTGPWTETMGNTDQFYIDPSYPNSYVVTNTDGSEYVFNDFSSNWAPAVQGKLRLKLSPGQTTTQYTYDTPPTAPSTSTFVSGSLGARTYNVVTSYVESNGDLLSTEVTQPIAVGSVLKVTSPPASPNATQYRVYVSQQLTAPTFPGTVFTGASTTGGALQGGSTYRYKVTALTAHGETTVSSEQSYAVPSGTNTNQVALNWNAVSGATGYHIYRTAASGASGSEQFLDVVTGGSSTSYTDNTASVPSGSPPSINTSGQGDETLQTTQTIGGSPWQEPNTGLVSGTAIPVSAAARILSTLRTDTAGTVTTKEQFIYTYLPSGDPNVGKVKTLTLERKVYDTSRGQTDAGTPYTPVQALIYTYYGSGSSFGNLGDLELVQTADGGPAQPAATAASGGSLTASTTYFYKITAVTAGGEGNASSEVSAATTSTNKTINLSWTAFPNATGYNIYRSNPLNAPTFPGTVFTGAANTGGVLQGGKTYRYKVTAISANGETLVSAEKSYTVPSGTNTNKITLNWNTVAGSAGYRIYRTAANGASGTELLLTTVSGGSTSTYVDNTNTTPAGSPPASNTTGPGDEVLLTQVSGTAITFADGGTLTPGTATPPTALIGTTYYRYYVPSDGSATGQLKYVFNPQSYARLAASLSTGTPLTASNTTVAPFADAYYQYDSEGRVSQQVIQGTGCSTCSGGLGTFTFSYLSSGSSGGYNYWASKTTETLPDGTINYLYFNGYGQEMLSVLDDVASGRMYGTFTEYDSNGRPILVASPSAVMLPPDLSTLEQYPDLLHNQPPVGYVPTPSLTMTDGISYTSTPNYQYLSPDSGLITITDYYTSTTYSASSTAVGQVLAGGVAGYVKDTKVEQGQDGAQIETEAMDYYVMNDVANAVVYPMADDTLFGTSGSGGNPRVTKYYYTWDSTTNQPTSQTVVQPVIGSGQHGPDTVSGTMSAESSLSMTASSLSGGPYPDNYFVGWLLTDTSITVTDPVTHLAVQDRQAVTTITGYSTSTNTFSIAAFPPSIQSAVFPTDNFTLTPGASVQVFDKYGRVSWTKDAQGFIGYTAYDVGTGAVVKSITDVNLNDTADFSSALLPSGWLTPTGGGKELITTTTVDVFGRPLKTIDPDGNVTYTVYNDTYATNTSADLQGIRNEVRTYIGWSNGTTTGPIQISREYRPLPNASSTQQTLYDETLTSSAGPHATGGVPDGSETLSSSNVQALTRNLTNAAGQMVETDQYFSLAGVTYASAASQPSGAGASGNSATGNFHPTYISYDDAGRENRVQNADGTINRTVYDGNGRVVSKWVGTDDTPGSGFWSPTNNTSPSNMVEVEKDYYDQRQPAPTGVTVSSPSSGTPDPGTFYVKVTYVGGNGESLATSETTRTVSSGQSLNVAVSSYVGAAGFNVYVSRQLSVPTFPGTVFTAASTTGGSLHGGNTYRYMVTALSANGETTVSAEQSYAVPSGTNTNQITVNWTAVSGAVGYKIYRTAAGGASNSELLLATVAQGTTTSYTDNTSTTPSGAKPTSNTTGPGDEALQNSSPVAFGTTGWSDPGGLNFTGAPVPVDQVGDSNLTESAMSVDSNPAHDHVTLNLYDYRDRLVATKGGALITSGIPNPAGESTVQIASQLTYAVNWPQSMVASDLNGDGIPDLAVANYSGSVSVLLGNGDGTFHAQVTYAAGLGYNAHQLAIADFNGDGKSDLVVTETGGIGILLGNGNGTFQPQVTIATISTPWSIAAQDLNADGKTDIVVSNSSVGGVMLGNGNGTFQAVTTFDSGTFPRAIAIADLSGDGKPDLVLSNDSPNTVSVLLGNGNGTFAPRTTLATGFNPQGVTLSDVNADGKVDIVVANRGGSTAGVFLGNGNGTFQAQATYATTDSPEEVAVADMNGDGIPDLVADGFTYGVLSVMLGNGNGTFKPQQTLTIAYDPYPMLLADVNGDGAIDVVAGSVIGNVDVILNQVPVAPMHRQLTYYTYDNAGEVTSTSTYAADGISLEDFANGNSGVHTSLLRGYSADLYDDQGRVYQSQRSGVDPTTGTVSSNFLQTDSYYDLRGNPVATFAPGWTVNKTVYDGAGRPIHQYVTDGGATNNSGTPLLDWVHANSVTSDIVLSQADMTYDPAGNLIQSITRERNDNATVLGDLSASPTSARSYYTANWYDAANRLTDTVKAGTNGGVAYADPSSITGRGSATGSTSTLIDSSRIEATGFFIGYRLTITSGTDAGQTSVVTAYNSATHTFTFSPSLTGSSTDNTSAYILTAPPPGEVLMGYSTASGSSTTLVDTSRTEPTGYFVGYQITITAGTGSGQTSVVTGWNSATGTFTVSPSWGGASPNSTSVYNLTPGPVTGTAASGSTTTLVDTNLTGPSQRFVGWTLTITAGPNSGSSATVTGYNASTGTLTFSPAFSTSITSSSHYSLTLPALLSHMDFDAGGRVRDTLDPRGIASGTFYDMLARQTQTIGAWDGSSSPAAGNSANQITNYTFNGNSNILTMTAVQPGGGATANQTTAYVYGVGGALGTNLFSNDLISTIEYPDAGTGAAGTLTSQQQDFGYDWQGEKTKFTDQNGTTHVYNFDALGRLTTDKVTAFAPGIDVATSARAYSFNDAGLPYQQLTLDTIGVATSTLTDTYNGLGQLIEEDQPSGNVLYTYSEMKDALGNAINNSRLTSTVYPDGRIVNDIYGGVGRISNISYNSGTHVATVTTYLPTGYAVGSPITIQGASEPAFDGNFTVSSVIDSTHFTFTPTGTPGVSSDPASTDNDMTLTGTQFLNISSISHSGMTATAGLPSGSMPINLTAGATFTVTISGATPFNYNGTFTATVVNSTSFTYTMLSTPGSNASGSNIVGTLTAGGSLDSAISRVSGLQDAFSSYVYAGYQYMGISTIVQQDSPQPAIDLSYIHQPGDTLAGTDAGDEYTGLDRFGRIVDQNWVKLNSPTTSVDRIQYGYDNDGNVLYRDDLVNTGYSQVYGYDALNRLTGFTQGTINGTRTAITGTPSDSGTYTMDSVGNMTTFGSGSRTVNADNQLTSGPYTPGYDANGNLISGFPRHRTLPIKKVSGYE